MSAIADKIAAELMSRESMRVCVAGWTASGKSHYAKLLAQQTQCNYLSGSSVLLDKLDLPRDANWIDSRERINAKRVASRADRRADRDLLDQVRVNPRIVVDSWTLPWLGGDDLVRIWIECDEPTRIRKAVHGRRDHPDVDLVLVRDGILQKDRESADAFRRDYGFEYGPDPRVFDAILDCSAYFAPEPSLRPAQERAFYATLTEAVANGLASRDV